MRYKLIVCKMLTIFHVDNIGSLTLFIVSDASYKIMKQKKRQRERRQDR